MTINPYVFPGLKPEVHEVSIGDLVRACRYEFGVSRKDWESQSRRAHVAVARNAVAYLLKEFKYTNSKTAEVCGYSCRSSVPSTLINFRGYLHTDPILQEKIRKLRIRFAPLLVSTFNAKKKQYNKFVHNLNQKQKNHENNNHKRNALIVSHSEQEIPCQHVAGTELQAEYERVELPGQDR